MRISLGNALRGNSAVASMFVVLGMLLAVGLACNSKGKDAKPVPAEYFGEWKGDDGSTLNIRGDGSGDYHSGNTKVDGGSIVIDDAAKTLSITFFGLGPSLKIDSPPSGNQMKLGGVTYSKGGGSTSDTKKTTTRSGDAAPVDTPSDSEAEALVKASTADFTQAVEDDDFTDFYDNASADFRASYTKDEIATTFKSFVDQKEKVLPSLNSAAGKRAKFSSAPSLRTEKGIQILTANGEFPSTPYPVKFETDYEMENGDWKLLKFKIKM